MRLTHIIPATHLQSRFFDTIRYELIWFNQGLSWHTFEGKNQILYEKFYYGMLLEMITNKGAFNIYMDKQKCVGEQ